MNDCLSLSRRLHTRWFITEKLLVSPDAGLYSMINQGVLTVEGIDDVEEMKLTDEAFDILGFTADEKLSLYKCI